MRAPYGINFAVMFSAVRVYIVRGEEDVGVWARTEVKHKTKETAWKVDSNMVAAKNSRAVDYQELLGYQKGKTKHRGYKVKEERRSSQAKATQELQQ